jgi:hypothetical protein
MLESESPAQALSVLMSGWPFWRLCSVDCFCYSEVHFSSFSFTCFSFVEVLVIEIIEIDARFGSSLNDLNVSKPVTLLLQKKHMQT